MMTRFPYDTFYKLSVIRFSIQGQTKTENVNKYEQQMQIFSVKQINYRLLGNPQNSTCFRNI